MAKISRAGGPSNALTRTAFGGHVVAGLTERAAGFSDDTTATTAEAEQHQEALPPEVSAPPFDPGDYTVAEVNAALPDLTEAEQAAVLDAERAGLNRKGITG